MMQDLLISQTYSSFVAYIEHSYQGGTITNRKKKKKKLTYWLNAKWPHPCYA